MGSSLSCLLPESSFRRNVLVIKENGEPIRYREGTRVNEIVAANPDHKVIRCGTDESVSVLPDSYQLGPNGRYFLILPDNDTSNTITSMAQSKELIISQKPSPKAENQTITPGSQVDFLFDGSEYRRSPWKPALHTIQEIASPPQHANVYAYFMNLLPHPK